MCGIYGCIPKNSDCNKKIAKRILPLLANMSQSRGRDASGIAIVTEHKIQVLKRPIPVSKLMDTNEWKTLVNQKNILAYIGHARMETNGSYSWHYNNQPVVAEGCVSIHNGIIVNADELWNRYPDLNRRCEVDTEIINVLTRKYLKTSNIATAIKKAFSEFEGAFSTATLFEDYNLLCLATNTGSLYTLETEDVFMFASEKYFLEKLKNKAFSAQNSAVRHLNPGAFLLYDIGSHKINFLDDDAASIDALALPVIHRNISIVEGYENEAGLETVNVQENRRLSGHTAKAIEHHYGQVSPAIDSLRRCTKCILPISFPFIEFDTNGVCNYCRNFKKQEIRGRATLEAEIEKFRRIKGKPDCVVPFSGGRDSSYGVYFLKKELGLNPLTYTYDWGMVTDLARRNIARMTGQLGIENILISADISAKRRNVKLNVEAWLKKPEMGMIPIFMAGDKHFFHYVNKVKRANNIKMDIWMGNRLENTDFKAGYCGVRPSFSKARIDALNVAQKSTMGTYYLKNYLTNPAYINSSLLDTLWSFYAYYFEPRKDYYLLFDYIPWDEQIIESTLINDFDWETATDTTSTWRIGDGTAPLYNYIYYIVAGFNENDTFRSNQIREGMLSRSEALELVRRDNTPRFESLKWYFDTIDVDMQAAIKVIHSIPKYYEY
jgi:predicted glutamine amidotransferase